MDHLASAILTSSPCRSVSARWRARTRQTWARSARTPLPKAKDMREYHRHCRTVGYEAFTDEEVEEQHRQAAETKTEYGAREFERPYAWASPLFGGRAPRFDELEERAGLAHLRPFYSWASYDIHAMSTGTGLNMLPGER
jgi:hypothetical protein